MKSTALDGGAVMTDFQFKAVMNMVVEILRRSEDIDDAVEAINAVMRHCAEEEGESV
jgi:hypothetical protein